MASIAITALKPRYTYFTVSSLITVTLRKVSHEVLASVFEYLATVVTFDTRAGRRTALLMVFPTYKELPLHDRRQHRGELHALPERDHFLGRGP